MDFKRNIRYRSRGMDVLWIKRQLLDLGYFAPSVKEVVKDTFGLDTLRAVRAFQQGNTDEDGERLRVDGVVGRKTWNAVLQAIRNVPGVLLPENIGKRAAAAIAPELARVKGIRQTLVLHALTFAFDPAVPARYPHSLYIRGGNLYNPDRTPNVITPARIQSGAKRQPQYYNNGRKEMMLEAVRADAGITGADCSGGIVGLMRKYALVAPTFDATADMMTGSRYSSAIAQRELRPGDWVGRPGHIGIYAGGGYVVEWMGGAYGCQLSSLSRRQGYSFTARRLVNQGAWTRYRRPDAY